MSGFATVSATLARHWLRRPGQLVTLVLGLAVATALWSGVQALNAEARQSYGEAAARIAGADSARLVPARGEAVDEALFARLRLAGWAVSPVVEGPLTLSSGSVTLVGIEPVTLPADGAVQRPDAAGIGIPDFLSPPGMALASPATLADLGLAAGDRPQTPLGPLPPLTEAEGVARGTIVTDIGPAQRLLGREGQISYFLLGARRGDALVSIEGGRSLAIEETGTADDLARLTDSFHLNLTAFGFLAFVVGLFIAHGAAGLAVEQRLGTVRTLRALGVPAGRVAAALTLELAVIAAVAGLIGVAGGYLVAALLLPDVAATLRGLYGARVSGELTLGPSWWLWGLAISMIGAVAVGLRGVWRLTRMPVLATGQARVWAEAEGRSVRLQALLALCALGGAAMAGFLLDGLVAAFAAMAGVLLGTALLLPGALARLLALAGRRMRGALPAWVLADARMQLPGLSLALMAMMLALSANIAVGTMVGSFRMTFTGWLEGRLAAELYLRAPDEQTAEAIAADLRTLPAVDAVLPVPDTAIRVGGLPATIHGLADHGTYRTRFPTLSTLPGAWDRLAKGGGAMVSEQLWRRSGLSLGDPLTLEGETATWPVEIVGIYPDYGNPRGQVRIGIDDFTTHYPSVPLTDLQIRAPPAEVPALMSRLVERHGIAGRSMIDQDGVRREALAIFERTFAVTAALNALTLAVAGLALFTALLTLAEARLPQIAPLWAIGVTRGRLAGAELAKLLGLTLATALMALPLGLVLAWLLVAVVNVEAFGWRLPLRVFPGDWARLVALALAAAALAALLPVLRLRRTPPSRLIAVFANER